MVATHSIEKQSSARLVIQVPGISLEKITYFEGHRTSSRYFSAAACNGGLTRRNCYRLLLLEQPVALQPRGTYAMSATTIALGIGVLIAVICTIDAARWNKQSPQTLHRFFLLNGELKLRGFTLTISAANLSLGNFIIFISIWGYSYGLTGLLVFIGNLVLNVVGFLLYLKTFRGYIEDRANSGTIHEYIAISYCKNGQEWLCSIARLFASLVTVIGLGLAILFELSLAVSILRPQGALESVYMFSGLAVLIAIFTANGGFRTLFVSDAFNGFLLAAGSVALCLIMWQVGALSHSGPYSEGASIDALGRIGWPAIISICVIGSGWMLVAMDQWQRACAARSYGTTWRGTLFYLGVVIIAAIIFASWGAFSRNVLPQLFSSEVLSNGSNPLMDITLFASAAGSVKILALVAITGLVFAAVATTNTFLNVLSHSLTSDVIVGLIGRRDIHSLSDNTDKFFVTVARVIITAIAAFLIIIFAIFSTSGLLTDPLSFFFIAYSVQFALLAPMAVTAVSKSYRPGAKSVIVSLALGFATAVGVGFGSWLLIQRKVDVIFELHPGEWLTLAPVVTLAVGLLPLIIGGLAGYEWNRHRRGQ